MKIQFITMGWLDRSLPTYVVFLQELLGVVVAIDVDLGRGVEYGGVLATCLYTSF